MLSKELASKSVEELAPLIENKSVSPVEITEAVLDQAVATQETVNSYMEIYREDALEEAEKRKRKLAMGFIAACIMVSQWLSKILFT